MTDAPEFVTEAQEIVEGLSRDLLAIERQLREDAESDPELLNAAFRAVHTLKGLSSLGGDDSRLGDLSHRLESMMDGLRLGKHPLGAEALDLMFESVELFTRILGSLGGDTDDVDTRPFLARLERFTSGGGTGSEVDALAWLDDSILGVLTEYEEHRLRENVKNERRIFMVHASFDLLAIDVGLEALKQRMKAYGEVITYLPSADASSDDKIDMDVLLGSKSTVSEIAAGLDDMGVTVSEMGAKEPREATGARPRPNPTQVAPRAQAPVPASVPTPAPVAEPVTDTPLLDDPQEVSLRSVTQTVRVDLRRLDTLMNLVGELGIVQANLDALLEQAQRTGGSNDFTLALQDQLRVMSRRLGGLQSGILEVRMVPLGQVFDKLARVIRKIGRESEKDVRLNISGAETELDKLIVEELSDPLMHMVRNAIDHGIEGTDERVAQGKSGAGRIDLRAYQKGNRVVIEVEDDGRGMDWREIRDRAVQRGFATRAQAEDMSPREAIGLIFEAGFSTRTSASELSGRGVGMDVVRTNISRLSGMIDVFSDPGRGTLFTITLPVTLAIIQALVIQAAKETFCIPLNSVLESIMVEPSDVDTIEGHEVVSLRGRTLPLIRLAELFSLDQTGSAVSDERLYVVVVGVAQHRVGLVVDELLGQRDVVIKSLGRALSKVRGLAGATELGANRTVLLLDVAALVADAVSGGGGGLRDAV
jgi:two-component system chemotaxis sensor kinase CheA